MSHISGARTERTQECIFTAPLGISRLVNVLSDAREPARNGMCLLEGRIRPLSIGANALIYDPLKRLLYS